MCLRAATTAADRASIHGTEPFTIEEVVPAFRGPVLHQLARRLSEVQKYRFNYRIYAVLFLTIPLLAQPTRITGKIDGARRVTLPASLHRKAQVQNDQGPVEPSTRLSYLTAVVAPTPEQQISLEELLADQQDRSSPNYHRWLTPQQFGDRFGLNPSDYNAVASWLTSQGFAVEAAAHARNWIVFSGTAEQIQHAFHTAIHRYLVNGEIHMANAS